MELQNRKHATETALPTSHIGEVVEAGRTRDEKDLIRLGKKPVLKASYTHIRNFGFMSILGFSCTVLITWEGMLIVSTQSLLNGGPAGVIWGYIIVWIGTISTFVVLSELASIWVAMLAPDRSKRFLSYITGWMTFVGWQAVTASAAYLIGTLFQSIILMTKSDYIPKPWQSMLFLWAILAFAVVINTVASKTLAHFEGVILVLHVLGFFAVLIPLVYLSPHGNTSLFTTFVNGEEIKKASIVVPRAMLSGLILNGVLGFAMMIAYLFCLGDLDDVLNAQETLGYPFLYVFQTGTGSTAGAAVMGLIVVALGVCSTVGALASSSRMLWSFARDRGVPLWRYWVKLDRRTSIPIYTIAFTTMVSILLSLIILGSGVAFNNIVNLSIAGLYSSYLVCCGMLLWRRLQSRKIKAYDPRIIIYGADDLHWGPWRIPGILGVVNNLFACILVMCVASPSEI
ncbi:hypothetical protein SS1G_12781 [Sclerotinia sclerotiorum 1980 UF-70]|uniref:Amino acid permease/ SLC12A domain-containing protein n=1 Tax=Sclerotinia sclerotiorum (strain ATCC 18683 / 1980 / Ss-1) TaxID=665079 RepID=A7F5A5_SCLS1|nr:hypothetical protein SS1G_12781 [Sclerotinia sclerotiorum 1980 UF-70]EDN97926.1 hypothetical protein SS1G_12781 [Sclerotinia sclerotiorum 1980 UF-70]